MKGYKRKYRELSANTKQKISATLRGKQNSSTHRANISKGLKNYWKDVPSRNEQDKTAMK